MSCRRVSSLIYAGWLPQDGTFESELAAGSKAECDLLQDNVITHSPYAGHSKTLADAHCTHLDGFGVVSPAQPPVTNTSRRVHVLWQHWRPRSASYVRRNEPSGRADAGLRSDHVPSPLGRR